MNGPPDDDLIESLTAFADGELDAAQTAAMWAYLADHPERHAALTWLRDQQKLTLAARKVARHDTPADLRDRVAAMNAAKAQTATSLRRSGVWGRIGYPLAAAAGLAIGLSLATVFVRPARAAEVLPGKLVTAVARVHADCSRLPETLHNATFESTDATLATTMKASLGTNTATPDLQPAGFRFVGADHCLGNRTPIVHLLYRSTDVSSVAAVSVFVQADTGKYAALEAGRVYRVSSTTSPFPTLAWKSSGVVYVLLADDDNTENAVLQTMHPTPASAILTVASR